MSITLRKQRSERIPTPVGSGGFTLFVDQNGNPSFKNPDRVIPAVDVGTPLQLNKQASIVPAASAVKVYAKDSEGRTEFFSVDDTGAETRLTQGGSIPSNLNVKWKDDVPGNSFDNSNVSPTHADIVQVLIDPTTSLSGEGDKEGVIVSTGDRVLRACAASVDSQINNGIYIVAAGAWSRATDADTGAEIQDAVVEMVTDAGPPSTVERWGFWNPTGVIVNVGTDPQNWVPLQYLSGSYPDKTVNAVAVSNISLSGVQTIDDVVVSPGDKVLVAAQTNPIDNGMYEVASGAWTRWSLVEGIAVSGGTTLYVTSGTLYSGRYFCLRRLDYRVAIVGVDPLYWVLLETENLSDFGPVRVDVNFNDVVFVNSIESDTLSYSYVIITLPPIISNSAGREIFVLNCANNFAADQKQIAEPIVLFQPAGTDSFEHGAPGEIMAVQTIGGGGSVKSDGVGNWKAWGAFSLIFQGIVEFPPSPTP